MGNEMSYRAPRNPASDVLILNGYQKFDLALRQAADPDCLGLGGYRGPLTRQAADPDCLGLGGYRGPLTPPPSDKDGALAVIALVGSVPTTPTTHARPAHADSFHEGGGGGGGGGPRDRDRMCRQTPDKLVAAAQESRSLMVRYEPGEDLGVRFKFIPAIPGVMVTHITPGKAWSRSGAPFVGDIIVEVAGKSMLQAHPEQVALNLHNSAAGCLEVKVAPCSVYGAALPTRRETPTAFDPSREVTMEPGHRSPTQAATAAAATAHPESHPDSARTSQPALAGGLLISVHADGDGGSGGGGGGDGDGDVDGDREGGKEHGQNQAQVKNTIAETALLVQEAAGVQQRRLVEEAATARLLEEARTLQKAAEARATRAAKQRRLTAQAEMERRVKTQRLSSEVEALRAATSKRLEIQAEVARMKAAAAAIEVDRLAEEEAARATEAEQLAEAAALKAAARAILEMDRHAEEEAARGTEAERRAEVAQMKAATAAREEDRRSEEEAVRGGAEAERLTQVAWVKAAAAALEEDWRSKKEVARGAEAAPDRTPEPAPATATAPNPWPAPSQAPVPTSGQPPPTLTPASAPTLASAATASPETPGLATARSVPAARPSLHAQASAASASPGRPRPLGSTAAIVAERRSPEPPRAFAGSPATSNLDHPAPLSLVASSKDAAALKEATNKAERMAAKMARILDLAEPRRPPQPGQAAMPTSVAAAFGAGPATPVTIIDQVFALWPACADPPGASLAGKRPTYLMVKNKLIDEYGAADFAEHKEQIKAILRNAAGTNSPLADTAVGSPGRSGSESPNRSRIPLLTPPPHASVRDSLFGLMCVEETSPPPMFGDTGSGDLQPFLDGDGDGDDDEATEPWPAAPATPPPSIATAQVESPVDYSPVRPCGHASLVVLGAAGVGKSAMVSRLLNNNHWLTPTEVCCILECRYVAKRSRFSPQKLGLTLEVRDTAGDPRYRPLTRMYCHEVSAALIVYDVTRRDTFNEALSLVQDMKDLDELPVLMLVGNVFNCATAPRDVQWDEAEAYAQFYKLLFCEVKSASNAVVAGLFDALTLEIVARREPGLVNGTVEARHVDFHEAQCRRANVAVEPSSRGRTFTVL